MNEKSSMADVVTIYEHRCAYVLYVDGVWRSASPCHAWQIVSMDPPAPKRRVA